MYLFCVMFYVFISISLVFLILLQPGKGFNNTSHLNMKNHIKFFSNLGNSNFITNVISIFSFLFLLISIILCNINSRQIEPDFFSEDHVKNTIENQYISDEKLLKSDIPH